ncbi:hypothetical protein FQA39_LY01894 [Lamprigera yunnana]|nr:hypothetical protein FQA39_LY01894 [Lamprigera yunnana]
MIITAIELENRLPDEQVISDRFHRKYKKCKNSETHRVNAPKVQASPWPRGQTKPGSRLKGVIKTCTINTNNSDSDKQLVINNSTRELVVECVKTTLHKHKTNMKKVRTKRSTNIGSETIEHEKETERQPLNSSQWNESLFSRQSSKGTDDEDVMSTTSDLDKQTGLEPGKQQIEPDGITNLLLTLNNLKTMITGLGSPGSTAKINKQDMLEMPSVTQSVRDEAISLCLKVAKLEGVVEEQQRLIKQTITNRNDRINKDETDAPATFAEAARNVIVRSIKMRPVQWERQQVVVIRSNDRDATLTAAEITTKLKKAINPTKNEINIKRVRPTKSNTVIIETQDKTGLEKIINNEAVA